MSDGASIYDFDYSALNDFESDMVDEATMWLEPDESAYSDDDHMVAELLKIISRLTKGLPVPPDEDYEEIDQ